MSFLSNLFGGQAQTPTTEQASNQGQINNEIAQQSGLVRQLQQEAIGGGPNPAAQQLQNAVAQNAAANNALAASQRGINPGLAARNAIEANATMNQTAAGQAAQAAQQQALAAQGQEQNLLNTQIGQGLQASQAQGQIAAGINSGNANNAQSATGSVLGGFGAAVGLADGGTVGDDDNAIPPALAPSTPSSSNSKSSGGGIGSLAALALLANGGQLRQRFADGSDAIPPALAPMAVTSNPANTNIFSNPLFGKPKAKQAPAPTPGAAKNSPTGTTPTTEKPAQPQTPASGPQSFIGKAVSGLTSGISKTATNAGQKISNAATSLAAEPGKIASDIGSLFSGNTPDSSAPTATPPSDTSSEPTPPPPSTMAKGGKVPALVSRGERYLPPSEVKKVEKGEKSPMKAGERIPGKPKYPGNDYRNDTVKKTLKEGGVVIPNSVTMSPDAERKAIAFMNALKSGKERAAKK